MGTLLVTIGPVETAAVVAGVTGGLSRHARTSLARRSVSIAGLVLLLFALGGGPVLSLLHVTLPAFRVAGGALLFLQALTMVFSGPGMSSISEGERAEATGGGDIAVFPLAFPILKTWATQLRIADAAKLFESTLQEDEEGRRAVKPDCGECD